MYMYVCIYIYTYILPTIHEFAEHRDRTACKLNSTKRNSEFAFTRRRTLPHQTCWRFDCPATSTMHPTLRQYPHGALSRVPNATNRDFTALPG